jgi:hypothetical protein
VKIYSSVLRLLHGEVSLQLFLVKASKKEKVGMEPSLFRKSHDPKLLLFVSIATVSSRTVVFNLGHAKTSFFDQNETQELLET